MRLVVVGAGAIGGGIGGLVAHAGLEVAVVARGAHGEAIAASGLRVARPDGATHVRPARFADPAEVDWRPDDVILLAVKLFDVRPLLAPLRQAAGDLTVVGAQNGVHADAWIAARFSRVISTFVWVPAACTAPGEVRLHGVPDPGVVDVGPGGEFLVPWLQAAGFRSQHRSDIARFKHSKWASNLAGSAFAVGRPDLAEAAIEEGLAILRASRIPFADAKAMDAAVGYLGVADVDGVARDPGGSAVLARAAGRPLETSYLNGAIVDLADTHGLRAPVNAAICALAESTRAP